jgi:hypothetical protein
MSAGARNAPVFGSSLVNQGRFVVRIGRIVARIAVLTTLGWSWGCAHGLSKYRKMQQAAPLMRAKSIGLAGRMPDPQALPALVSRLDDSDPVVRLAAHEELRRRTGRDFGFVPWASSEERSGAVERWHAWLGQETLSSALALPSKALPPLPGKTLPDSPSVAPTSWRDPTS